MVTRAGPVEVDANGNTIIVGAAASDAAASGNPLLMGGVVDETSPASAGEGDARTQLVTPEGKQRIVIEEDGSGSTRAAITAAADGFSNPTALETVSFPHLYNGTTWDRMRGVTHVELLAGATNRAATNNSPDQTNYNAKGVVIFFDVTTVPGSDTVHLKIQSLDIAEAKAETFMVTPTISAAQRDTYIIYPGVGAAAEDIVEVVGYPLPRKWRIQIVHSGSGTFQYLLEAHLIW